MNVVKSRRSVKVELGLAALLLLVLLGLRLWDLEADPPQDLSDSTSIYTDHPQYTLYARYFVETGEFNPYQDHRQPFFLKSMVTLLAVPVFKMLGVGLYQSNLVGLLYAFGALFLFWLLVRKWGGGLVAIIFLLLAGLNYNLFFFGRLPFLEHAMLFYAALAALLVSGADRIWRFVLGGICLGVAIFFGKIIGLIFLFPFACLLIYQAVFDTDGVPGKRWFGPAVFASGWIAVALFWYIFGYLATPDSVTGYIGEQAYDLYGAPDGLQSFSGFVKQLVTFGIKSELMERMIVPSLLAMVLVLILVWHVCRRRSWKDGFGRLDAGQVFMVTMIIAFWGSLMIWNYRPLRYQLALIYPVCAAAAWILARMITPSSVATGEKTPVLFYFISLPIAYIAIMQLGGGMAGWLGGEFSFDDHSLYGLAAAIVLALVFGAMGSLYQSGQLPSMKTLGRALAALTLLYCVAEGIDGLNQWRDQRAFTLRDNARDISNVVGEGAILSGPYGPAFGLVSDHDAVIHMFGPTGTDTTVFDRFPVTHLLLDEANEERAKEFLAPTMDLAAHVCTYHVGLKKVKLYRIAGFTDNQQATQYQPTTLEYAILLRGLGDSDQAFRQAQKSHAANPDGITGNLLLSDLAETAESYNMAESHLKKAVEFSPTNYNLNAALAMFYKGRFEQTREVVYKTNGLQYFERATSLAPSVAKIQRAKNDLEDGAFEFPKD